MLCRYSHLSLQPLTLRQKVLSQCLSNAVLLTVAAIKTVPATDPRFGGECCEVPVYLSSAVFSVKNVIETTTGLFPVLMLF